MSFNKMIKMLRITDEEAELIRRKSIEINRKLLEGGQMPMKDSELVHKLIELAIDKIYVSQGKLFIE